MHETVQKTPAPKSRAGCWRPPAIPSVRQGASMAPAAGRVLSGSMLHSTQAATRHRELDRPFAQAQDPPAAHSSTTTSKLPQGRLGDWAGGGR